MCTLLMLVMPLAYEIPVRYLLSVQLLVHAFDNSSVSTPSATNACTPLLNLLTLGNSMPVSLLRMHDRPAEVPKGIESCLQEAW